MDPWPNCSARLAGRCISTTISPSPATSFSATALPSLASKASCPGLFSEFQIDLFVMAIHSGSRDGQ